MSSLTVPASIDLVETRNEQRRYDRIASVYDLFEAPMEWLVHRRLRRELFRQVGEARSLLEVGVGTGRNFAFYPAGTTATAIDLSSAMLARARARARKMELAVGLHVADVQALAFPDASFDVVVATFVFCSVPDPVLGLRELARVCRPGGRILLLEHVRPDGRLGGKLADRMDPLTYRLWGAHVARRTVEDVTAAELRVLDVQCRFGIFRLISAQPDTKGPPS